MPVGFGVGRILAQTIQHGQLAALHGLEHIAQMPATLGMNLHTPSAFELRAQLVVLDVLKTRKPVGDRAHIAPALALVLPPHPINAPPIPAPTSLHTAHT